MRWALRQAMDLNYITRMANSLKWRVGHLTNMRDNGGGSLVISLGSLYSSTLCFWLCYFKTLAMARIRGKVVSMFKCLPGGICGRIQDSWQVYFLPGHKKNVKQSYRGRLERFQMKSCRMSSCIKVFIQEQTGFWSHWSAMVSPVLHSFFLLLVFSVCLFGIQGVYHFHQCQSQWHKLPTLIVAPYSKFHSQTQHRLACCSLPSVLPQTGRISHLVSVVNLTTPFMTPLSVYTCPV